MSILNQIIKYYFLLLVAVLSVMFIIIYIILKYGLIHDEIWKSVLAVGDKPVYANKVTLCQVSFKIPLF